MPEILLAPTTTATASRPITVAGPDDPVLFTCPGLVSAETGTLQKQAADGTFSDWTEGGTTQVVSATHSGLTVVAPGVWRINKSLTTASVPVQASSARNP